MLQQLMLWNLECHAHCAIKINIACFNVFSSCVYPTASFAKTRHSQTQSTITYSEKLSVTRDPKLRYFRCARLCWSKNLRYQLIQSKATKTNQVLGTGVPCSSKRMLVLSLSSQWLLKYFLSH